MTKITTYLKNPYWADSDDIVCNYVMESVREVERTLIEKGYIQEKDHWVDNTDPDDLRWVYITPFKIKIEKLDDVI